MIRSNAALAFLFAGALTCGFGCGDGGSKTGASAEPAKSGAAATTGTAKSSGAQAKTSAAPTGTGTAKTDAGGTPSTATADVLKHMPKDCDEGRVFVNMSKFLAGGDMGAAFDTLIGKAMAQGKADDKKAAEVMKVLKDGGIDPLKDVREIAVCANKDDKKTVVAVSMEPKADKPADVFAKAMETGEGKAPTKEEKDGMTFLKSGKGEGGLAVVSKNMILIGEDIKTLQGVAKGGDGAGEFGDAKSTLVWAKVDPTKTKTEVVMKEAGSDYDLNVKLVSKDAAKTKTEFEKMLPELDKVAEKMPFAKPLLPIAKNGKMDAQGENLTFTTKFPKDAIAKFLTEASKVDPKEIMKGLKF
jgi:hypothetical protein